MLVIELDDSSHRLEHRQKRDAFVDDVLCSADIPLLRVPVQRGYRTQELAAAIRERIGTESQLAATELTWPDCLFSTLTDSEPAG